MNKQVYGVRQMGKGEGIAAVAGAIAGGTAGFLLGDGELLAEAAEAVKELGADKIGGAQSFDSVGELETHLDKIDDDTAVHLNDKGDYAVTYEKEAEAIKGLGNTDAQTFNNSIDNLKGENVAKFEEFLETKGLTDIVNIVPQEDFNSLLPAGQEVHVSGSNSVIFDKEALQKTLEGSSLDTLSEKHVGALKDYANSWGIGQVTGSALGAVAGGGLGYGAGKLIGGRSQGHAEQEIERRQAALLQAHTAQRT